jgi:phage host-nuclease inhibitor protein Gam
MAASRKPITPGQVDRRLRKIGELDLMVEALERQMLRRLDAIKEEFGPRLEPLRVERTKREAALLEACEAARETLFEGEVKTLRVGSGEVSVRRKPARLELQGDTTEDDAIRRFAGPNLRFIRTEKHVDRQALRRAAVEEQVSAETLERLGFMLIEDEEVWAAKPDHEAVREAVGKR